MNLKRAHRILFVLMGMMMSIPPQARSQNRERYPLPSPAVPETLGVNIHFTDPAKGEMKQLADGGFKWVRMDFAWGGIERVKGKYDFSAYQRLLDALKPYKIRPIFILDYGNDLYEKGAPKTPEARAAFAKFAAASAKRFKNRGILWEMWNEPNGGFWLPKADGDEYATLALETGKAIRQAAPDEWFIGPATSGVDLNFIEKCFKAGMLKYWDAVSVHPYRNSAPETSVTDLYRLQKMIEEYAPKGKTIPIISGEWGYSEKYSGLNLEKQSKYIAREFLSNMLNGVILSIWYDWHDDGPDPNEIEHHFGTVYRDYQPKPTYRAARTLARTLDGFRFDKRLSLESPNDYCLLFSKKGESRLAVWTTSADAREVTLKIGAGSYQIISFTGETTTATASKDGLRLTISDAPRYVIPKGKSETLALASAWATLPSALEIESEADLRKALSPLAKIGASKDAKKASLAFAVDGKKTSRIDLKKRLAAGGKAELPVPFVADRGVAPHRLTATLVLDGSGEVSQESQVYAKYPLKVTPLSAVAGQIPVQIDNPTGHPFEGRISLLLGGEKAAPVRVPASMKKGETARIVTLSAPDGFAEGAPIRLLMEDRDESGKWRTALKTDPLSLVSLSPFSADQTSCRALPDGDPKIGFKIDCEIVAPPAGLPVKIDRAAKIAYQFDAGWKFLRIPAEGEMAEPLKGKPESLGVWVYGDASEDGLRMRFTDSAGQTFQPDGGVINWKGWRYVAFDLSGANAGHWGGPDDGIVRYPIHFDTLFLVDSGGRGSNAVVYAAGFALAMRGE